MKPMPVIDKVGVLRNWPADAVLELGCGDRKRHKTAIGVDSRDLSGVDLVGDVFDVLAAVSDGSVAAIYSYHFFEHISDFERLMQELSRLLKRGGQMEVVVPHFSNPYFYSDPTHRTPFGLYTFCYYASNRLFRRTIPNYQGRHDFTLKSVDLVFKAARPFYIRYALRKAIGTLFNSCSYMQEIYEDLFTGLISCYEVRYELIRR